MGHARGELELEGKVLVIKRIHVTYKGVRLADADQRATAERVLGFHADGCPVARSLKGGIEITTSMEADDSGS